MTRIKQKLAGVMVLLMFMLSVIPAALAEEGSGSQNQTEVDDDSDETNDEDDTADEAEDNDEADDEDETEVEEETEVESEDEDGKTKIVRKIKRELKGEDPNFEQAKIRLELARKQFEQAKENYREAKARFQENKDNLVRMKEKIKVCQEDGTCDKVKLDLRKGVRQHLLKTSDLIERSLNKLLRKVEGSLTLSEQEKEQALTSINELEAELTAKKEAVEAMAEESVTNEELKAAIKDLKATWIKVRKEQRAILAGLMNSRLAEMVDTKLPEINAALTEKISQMRELGAEVTELEAIQAEFAAQMAEVQQQQADAEEKWLQFKSGESDLEAWKEAQERVREGLKEAKSILREFMQEYKELKKGLKENRNQSDETEEVEVEAEV